MYKTIYIVIYKYAHVMIGDFSVYSTMKDAKKAVINHHPSSYVIIAKRYK